MIDHAPNPERDLSVLIRSMQPVLHESTYVFAHVAHGFDSSELAPLMCLHEQEGITLIIRQEQAVHAGLQHDFACRVITLNIHSALDAVGFLTRITKRLADLQMGVNPVSGFYHDHLFVPQDRAEDALRELELMAAEA